MAEKEKERGGRVNSWKIAAHGNQVERTDK